MDAPPFPASSSRALLTEAAPAPSRPQNIAEMVDETSHLPNGDLSLSQKLVKALILVLSGLHRNVAANDPSTSASRPPSSLGSLDETVLPPGAWPASPSAVRGDAPPVPTMTPPSPKLEPSRGQDAVAAANLAGLSTQQLSDLLEVLAAALRDASSAPWLWSSSPAYSPAVPPTSLPDFNVPSGFGLGDFCDPLSMPPGAPMIGLPAPPPPPPPPAPPAVSITAPPGLNAPAGGAAPGEIVVRDLPTLLFENLNDLVSLLKPATVPSSILNSPLLSPSTVVAAPTSPRSAALATDGAEAGASGSKKRAPINSLPSETLSRILALARLMKEAMACECDHPCNSSRGAMQRWALSLLLVCKEWKQAATYAAYSSVRLRRRNQVSGLVKLIRTRSELGDVIADVDVKVPGLQVPGAGPGGPGGPGGHPYMTHPRHGSRRAAAFPWLSPPEKRLGATDAQDDQLVSSLVDLCPGLSKLELNVAKPGFSYASWAYGADFLEQGLERALGAAPALRALTLRACIDFCELEAILTSCSTIEVLRLEGGVDNLDGTDDALVEPHGCRLKHFFLNSWESSDLGEAQLCWMLAPSIGTLQRLEVATSVGLTAAGLAGGNPFPPFSGYNFAELLVELAPTLIRLALKDSLGQGPGLGQGNPTLRAPPHDGHFDYALARCGKLRELALEWAYTGPELLTSLEGKPIEALALLGAPNGHTTAKQLATKLASYSSLDRLALAHVPLHQVVAGWSARDVRFLRRTCQERNLHLEFSTI